MIQYIHVHVSTHLNSVSFLFTFHPHTDNIKQDAAGGAQD